MESSCWEKEVDGEQNEKISAINKALQIRFIEIKLCISPIASNLKAINFDKF